MTAMFWATIGLLIASIIGNIFQGIIAWKNRYQIILQVKCAVYENLLHVNYLISNSGHQPVDIVKIGVEIKNGRNYEETPLWQGGNLRLDGNQQKEIPVDENTEMFDAIKSRHDFNTLDFYVRDAHGKKHLAKNYFYDEQWHERDD